MRSSTVLGAVGVLLALGAAVAEAQPASMVADLNTVEEDFSNPVLTGTTSLGSAALGSTLLFAEDDGIHGIELWKSDGTEAGTRMVKDICPGACGEAPLAFTVSNGVLYFLAQDGVHGQELWRSDGTEAGTSLVVDLNPGFPSGPTSLFELGGVLYLAADDGIHGAELWKTDGTAAGTVIVADIRLGKESSFPTFLAGGGGKLLFRANDGTHGYEPWLTDGTSAGTFLLKDIVLFGNSVPAQAFPGYESSAYALGGGSFLFTANDVVHGAEIWKTDGTTAGTVLLKDINPGGDSGAYGFTALGGSVLFAANDGTTGWELWSTDGTAAGTHLVKDLGAQPNGSFPRKLTPFGGRLFFAVTNSSQSRDLWATDGTMAGTVPIQSFSGGGLGVSFFSRVVLHAAGGGLFFYASDPTNGPELWTSDGTTAGTRRVKDIRPGPGPGVAFTNSDITVVGSTPVFFKGSTLSHGDELWKSDGTEAGTVEVKNVTTVTSSLAVSLGSLNSTFGRLKNRFYLDANDGVSGLEPWLTDGTAASMEQLADLTPVANNSSGTTSLFPDAGLLYERNGRELWKTDGTPAGTSPLVPPTPSGVLASLSPLVRLGSSWYFAGDESTAGLELWSTDGTTAGTRLVRDIQTGTSSSAPSRITAFGSLVLFFANDANGHGLWKSDGTQAGTVLLKNLSDFPSVETGGIIPLGPVALFMPGDFPFHQDLWVTDGTPAGTDFLTGSVGEVFRLGSSAVFTRFFSSSGWELWKTDGTAAGTGLLKDIQTGPGSAFPDPPLKEKVVIGNRFFFPADDGIHGTELWRTDGTTAGTVLVKDIHPGPRSSEVRWMTVEHSRLFFVADDGVHGRELWVSDGTEAGTRMVKDIVPGPGSPVIQHLKVIGRTVLFNATDGVHGVEPWKSDGTEAGTVMIQDVVPGAASSSAAGFFSLFPDVYFAANDHVAGFELWSFPRSVLGATFEDVPTAYWAWPYVEALADAGLTTGCGESLYCPTRNVTRAEMAVFVLRVIHGAGYVPPAGTGTVFTDVPAGYWASSWIEQLATEGITSGCSVSPAAYCPESATGRDQMAVFLLRALHGPAYTPPPATGTVFMDVPASYWAAAWIEQLAAEGITTGCGGNLYCPGDPVSRDQMAVFLTRALNLPLP